MADYPINRTPEHLRCTIAASCPAVYELEGGKLLIVGNRATPEDLRGPVDYNVGDEEEAIVIDRALLSDLVQTDVSQADVPSGHLDAAYWVVQNWQNRPEIQISQKEGQALISAIASALSEAYEAGRGLVQMTAEPATELSGHQNAEIAKLRGLLYSAQFALHAFTLVDEIPFDLDDQAKVEITITELSADSGPEFDVHTVAIRIGTDIMNARRIVEALEAQVTAPLSQGDFETKFPVAQKMPPYEYQKPADGSGCVSYSLPASQRPAVAPEAPKATDAPDVLSSPATSPETASREASE